MKLKKIISVIVIALISGSAVWSQTQYDAERFISTDLNGTARFVGMGGAMSALGGDISTMGTNPAGIGLFRRNDVSGTFSLNNTRVEANFGGVTGKDDRSRLSFDQLGVVFSTRMGDELRFVNFGINYRKQRNFNKRMAMYGDLMGLSLTDQIAWMGNHEWVDTRNNTYWGNCYNPIPLEDYYQMYDDLNADYYTSPDWEDVSWLTILGIQGGLIGPDQGTDGNTERGDVPLTDERGNPMTNENGEPLYDYRHYIGMPGYDAQYKSRETGGVNVVDLNMSFNVNDRIYFGLTVGVYDVNYERTSSYTEWGEFDYLPTDFTLTNSYRTEGTGADLKLGAIFRPIEESAFRFGLAIHTPTYYKLSDRHSAGLFSTVSNMAYTGGTSVATRDYELLTPWKFNFSLGHTIGTSVAIGAEYEYADYSSAKLRWDEFEDMYEETSWIEEDLKGVHTFRLGVEAKLIPEFSLRAGYNYSSAAFDKSAYKFLYSNDTRTDAEYENTLARNIFTVGMGYRFGQFYLDAAYQYACQKGEFYPFDSRYSVDALYDEDTGISPAALPATKTKTERDQVMFTFGYRF